MRDRHFFGDQPPVQHSPPRAPLSGEAMTPGDAEKPRPGKPPEIRKATGAETADLVSEVLKDAEHREESRSRKAPMVRSRQRVASGSLPLAGTVSFYLWFAHP